MLPKTPIPGPRYCLSLDMVTMSSGLLAATVFAEESLTIRPALQPVGTADLTLTGLKPEAIEGRLKQVEAAADLPSGSSSTRVRSEPATA